MLRQPIMIVKTAEGMPISAITATRIPISHATGVFRLSTCCVMCSFIRVSEAWIFASNRLSEASIASLTIKRIWLRSASVNSPRAGKATTEKRIESASIVFMGCSSASLIYPPAMVGGWQKRKKDSVHCSAPQIRKANLKQVAFLTRRKTYRAPNRFRSSQLGDFCFSSAGGMSARFSSFSEVNRSKSFDFSSISAVSRSVARVSCCSKSRILFS